MLPGCRGGSAQGLYSTWKAHHSMYERIITQTYLRLKLEQFFAQLLEYVRLWVSAIGAAPIQSRLPAGL